MRGMGRRLSLLATVSLLVAVSAHGLAGQTYTKADVDQALNDAMRFREEGKYEQALERHIWYHKNALRYDPAQYGVRLSFALGDWAELDKAYPKALHALRSIRNETLATFRKDPSDSLMFGEVMSIDLALNDLRSAKALFYEGKKHGERDDLLLLELTRIVDAGELKWARDVVGDPYAKLAAIKLQRDESLAALSTRKDLINGLDEMYAKQIASILKAVAKVDGAAAERRVQKKALQMFDSPVIRSALKVG